MPCLKKGVQACLVKVYQISMYVPVHIYGGRASQINNAQQHSERRRRLSFALCFIKPFAILSSIASTCRAMYNGMNVSDFRNARTFIQGSTTKMPPRRCSYVINVTACFNARMIAVFSPIFTKRTRLSSDMHPHGRNRLWGWRC